MNNTKAPRKTFVRGVTKALALTILPLIALLMFGNLYSISHSNQLIASSNQRVVSQWTDQIDANLLMIERTLANLVYIEPEFSTMGHGGDHLSVHLSTQTILKRLDTMMSTFPALGSLILYSAPDGVWGDTFAGGAYSYSFRESARHFIRAEGAWTDDVRRWSVQSIGDKNVLFYSLESDGAYLIAIADFDRLLSVTQETFHISYLDESGMALNPSLFSASALPDASAEGMAYMTSDAGDRYLTVWSSLSRAPVRLALAVSDAGYWGDLTSMQRVMLAASMLAVLAIPLARSWIRKNFGRPMEDLSSAMERIKRGELDQPIAQVYDTQELEEVKSTLNSMMSQIRTLKITAYERQLERQRIELQYLHLQLRPHFFLNCLKNIYACIQRQRYPQAQEMTLAVSDYIRYLFRDNRKTVTLREELRYVENYMLIQRLNLNAPPELKVIADESLMELRIPPLSVESFVENAVKHQWRPNRGLVVTVRAVLLEADDGKYLDITVHDNGDGFTDAVLEQINDLPDDIYQEYHVGLTNLSHRLKLIYGGRAALAFYNDAEGAVCEVICPTLEGQAENDVEVRA